MNDFLRKHYFPKGLTLGSLGLYTRVLGNDRQLPSAYVELIDVDGTVISISNCIDFKVSTLVGSVYGSFSCNLANASSWNLLGATEKMKLDPDLRRRIKIYYGQKIGSGYVYENIFVGIPTTRPESYTFAQSDSITISGYTEGYLLTKIDGTYITDTYTGTSKDLVGYWI